MDDVLWLRKPPCRPVTGALYQDFRQLNKLTSLSKLTAKLSISTHQPHSYLCQTFLDQTYLFPSYLYRLTSIGLISPVCVAGAAFGVSLGSFPLHSRTPCAPLGFVWQVQRFVSLSFALCPAHNFARLSYFLCGRQNAFCLSAFPASICVAFAALGNPELRFSLSNCAASIELYRTTSPTSSSVNLLSFVQRTSLKFTSQTRLYQVWLRHTFCQTSLCQTFHLQLLSSNGSHFRYLYETYLCQLVSIFIYISLKITCIKLNPYHSM